MPIEKWYSLPEFCLLYNMDEKTARAMLRGKLLHGFRLPGGQWRISSSQENLVVSTFETQSIDDLPLLRMAEVQTILNISPARARMLCENGQLSCTVIRKNRRFSVNDLRDYLVRRGKFRASDAKKQRVRELAHFARQRLGLEGPEPEIGYDADSMEELRAIIETIGNIPSEVRRAQCFDHLFRHFKETGRYIGMKPIPRLATESSSSHSPMAEAESPSSTTGSSSAANPEPNQ